ncbi:MAG: VOC family protein [Candidatus Zixiibacteriota bacterium]|jgi:predicted 3-demethylubiquinone-9 3-methyltransferase (glyoxalase superfamily)
MKSIMPCLWFDKEAEDAVNFYISVFKNSKILDIARFTESMAAASGQPSGTVMTVAFQLKGQDFLALNGGPHFSFTPAVSFVVRCDSQDEIDYYWDKLSEGGEIEQCGWLRDKYGLSWQIVPSNIGEMIDDSDSSRTDKVMKALLGMKKIDMNALQKAFEQV